MKKYAIAMALTGLMSTGAAQAIQVNGFTNGSTVENTAGLTSTGNNFTMFDGTGAGVGGATDVAMTWDGTVFTQNSDYTGAGSVSNMTLSSATTFFGGLWTAHTIQVFAPGSYSFDTADGGGGPLLNMNVGQGQLGAHMLFNWGSNSNIDVALVWDSNSAFASTEYGGGTGVWNSVSVDANGDGIPGIPMVDGAFIGFNANFNLNGITPSAVPVPAAVWLFGSGLLGLVGVARRKKVA